MKPISDINESFEKQLKYLTSDVKQIQDNLLEEIITPNTKTEYLQPIFLIDRFDKDLFKKNVPIVTYEDIKPYLDRVVNGESSDVISARPITGFLLRYIRNSLYIIYIQFLSCQRLYVYVKCFFFFGSSGTSGGAQKMMPWNNKYLDNLTFIYDLRMQVITK